MTVIARLIGSSVLLASATTLSAQSQDLTALADRVFAPFNSVHGPGCAVGVSRGGKVLLTRGYGMADLESGRANDASTIFESGSVAKQFTATAIVLLALDGKLSLDDDVRKFIPELPVYDAPITIRHLLNHTSGLREWSNLVALQGWPRGTRRHTQDVLVDIVARQKSLNYPVGMTYSYTNSGFGLLPTIVQRVTGKSLAAFSQERIFVPLGMKDTKWRDDMTAVVPRRAQGYSREGNGWKLEMPIEDVYGPGGLLTTVSDWLIWNDALATKKLGAAWADTLVHRSRTKSGREISYALGIINTSYRGAQEISHNGATAGYRTSLVRYPQHDQLSVAVLCNAATANPTALSRGMVDALIPTLAPAPALDTVATDSVNASRLVGHWVRAGDHSYQPIEFAKGRLTLGGTPLRALRSGGWLLGAATKIVPLDPRGGTAPTQLLRIDAESDTMRLDRVEAPLTALDGYVGRYRSDELEVTYDVTVERGALNLRIRAGVTMTLDAVYKDGFGSDDVGDVWFSRDAKGRIDALHVSGGRAWDVAFARLPAKK